MNVDILKVQPGDIVRFVAYSLSVESVKLGRGSIALTGRQSIDGCPMVTKRFLGGRAVTVDRAAPAANTIGNWTDGHREGKFNQQLCI